MAKVKLNGHIWGLDQDLWLHKVCHLPGEHTSGLFRWELVS